MVSNFFALNVQQCNNNLKYSNDKIDEVNILIRKDNNNVMFKVCQGHNKLNNNCVDKIFNMLWSV